MNIFLALFLLRVTFGMHRDLFQPDLFNTTLRARTEKTQLRPHKHGIVSDFVNSTCCADIPVETRSCLYMPGYLSGAGCKWVWFTRNET